MTEQELKLQRVVIDRLFKSITLIPKTRETSLAYTSCQLSKMWLGKTLNALGTAYPYPESKDVNTGNYIAPTADTGEAFALKGTTVVENIKGLRADVDKIVDVLVWDKEYKGGYSEWKKDEEIILAIRLAKQYMVECGMWLGMELGRIRDMQEVTNG